MKTKINPSIIRHSKSKHSFNKRLYSRVIKIQSIKEALNQYNINKNNETLLNSLKLSKKKNPKIKFSSNNTKILIDKSKEKINNNKTNDIIKPTKRKLNSASILTNNILNINKCDNISSNNISQKKLTNFTKNNFFRNKNLEKNQLNRTNKTSNIKNYSIVLNQIKKNNTININLSNNNILMNSTHLKHNKKTDIISYSYRRLQNKIRKFYSASREVLNNENKKSKKNKFLLLASPRNLFNSRFDGECLKKMNNSFYFGSYDSNKDFNNYFSIVDNNSNNQNDSENKRKIPCFENKLLASLTSNKEFKENVFVTASVKGENYREDKNKDIETIDIKNDNYMNKKKKNRIIVYHK